MSNNPDSAPIDTLLRKYLKDSGKSEKLDDISVNTVQSVCDARYKMGQLLFAGIGSFIGAVAIHHDPQIRALIQNPEAREIARHVFMVSAVNSFALLVYGRLKFQAWMDHCRVLKDAGVLEIWLREMQTKHPLIRPLVQDTALDELGMDITTLDQRLD